MTNLFVVGERVSAAYGTADIPSGEGRAFSGPGGFEVVLKIDDPTQSQIRAVKSGPIGLGVRDGGGEEAVFLLYIGFVDGSGCIEAEVRGPAVSGSSWTRMWWGEDIDLALVDSKDICRETREFAGPGEGLGNDDADDVIETDPESRPCVAVFPEDRYGLVQPKGKVTVDTILEYGLALTALPDWRPGLTEVWDLRGATTIDANPLRFGDLYRLESQTRKALRGSRTIIVLPEAWRPAVASVTRFYGRVAGSVGRSINVCKTVDGALSRLRIEQLPDLAPCESSD